MNCGIHVKRVSQKKLGTKRSSAMRKYGDMYDMAFVTSVANRLHWLKETLNQLRQDKWELSATDDRVKQYQMEQQRMLILLAKFQLGFH